MTHDSGQWRNETVPDVDLGSTLRATVGGLRRQWRLIAGLVLALLVLVLIYLQMAVPQYTARAALIVDPRISNSVNGPEAPTLLLSDALVVDSEIEVLSSRVVTSRVAENLGLFDAPDEEVTPGPLSRLRAIFASDETPILQGEDAEAARRETIRQKMMRGFEIRRAGGTYAIQIAFTDEDPVLASRAVNALIDEYFVAASDASLSDTRRISGWLEQRVAVLADEVKDADHAVASYRRENNLFVMRDDRLPSEAELSAANDRMIALRSRLIDLQTTEERITLILSSDSVAPLLDGTLGGEVASPALRDMQTRFSRLLAEGAELTGRWGEDSDIVARNRLDQSQLRDLMLDEVGQIAERVRSQIGAVRQQIIATESQIGELRDKASADAEKSIRLQELEREVEAKRSQYETMLGQMVLATQNETFQRAPARIIARAVPPDEKSKPAGKRLLVLSVFSGLVLGAGIAFLREVTDNRLRLVSDLRQGLGLRWLGVLPRQGTDPAPHLRDLTAELQRRRPPRSSGGRAGRTAGADAGGAGSGGGAEPWRQCPGPARAAARQPVRSGAGRCRRGPAHGDLCHRRRRAAGSVAPQRGCAGGFHAGFAPGFRSCDPAAATAGKPCRDRTGRAAGRLRRAGGSLGAGDPARSGPAIAGGRRDPTPAAGGGVCRSLDARIPPPQPLMRRISPVASDRYP
ncbi:Uncharacterized protein involved in exopolysaccharide biosynthesis [Paracoccus alcaliphilus]|uniref:Uncharacterized protein involved in exopolysaccharide biosynthesis n=1 Tax=Paracoccus alcaliphilus TaxID=34002 RepID=A0A1H8IBQ6_9RHOB|nr:GumC family protein [Paracoccus alcaliphilus]WCR19184.1 hypothetical protein JHW40_05735 [Paracoccus alcaliphilus]SEN65769.1 Uncharacterized protein involved in exopolysaccharide biosynthesis [Paracoccus alcaliphilus]